MNWEQVVQKVTPYIFKIETPAGHGTGFLYLYNDNKTWCGVSTALHVVDYERSSLGDTFSCSRHFRRYFPSEGRSGSSFT